MSEQPSKNDDLTAIQALSTDLAARAVVVARQIELHAADVERNEWDNTAEMVTTREQAFAYFRSSATETFTLLRSLVHTVRNQQATIEALRYLQVEQANSIDDDMGVLDDDMDVIDGDRTNAETPIELTSCDFCGESGCCAPDCWRCHSLLRPENLCTLAKNLATAAMLCRAWELHSACPTWTPGCGELPPGLPPLNEHRTTVVPHNHVHCHTARHAEGGDCGTHYETRCSCGWMQGARSHAAADAIAIGHRNAPDAAIIVTSNIPQGEITDDQLRDLFARHCECRPLDLTRGESGHAAIHDCDTGILHDIQVALGIVRSDDIGRTQAMLEARARCAKMLPWRRNAHGGWDVPRDEVP